MSVGVVMTALPPRPRSSANLSSMGGNDDDSWQVVATTKGKNKHATAAAPAGSTSAAAHAAQQQQQQQGGRLASDGAGAGGAPPRVPSGAAGGRRGSHTSLSTAGSKHATPGHSTPATPRRGSASGTQAHIAAAQQADEHFASFRKGAAFVRPSPAATTSDWRRGSLEPPETAAGAANAADAAAAAAAAAAAHAINGKIKAAGKAAVGKQS